MAGGWRRHRDTLAFVLTILGAALWSMWPSGAIVRSEGVGREVGMPLMFGAGACLGAWSATMIWRHVSRVMPAVIAAALAALVMEMSHEARVDAFGFGATEAIGTAAAAAGAVIGAELGRRTRTPRRTLVAAWIAISGPGLFMLGFGVAAMFDYEAPANPWVWFAILSVMPAAWLAVRLCGSVRPARFTWTLFALLTTIFVIAIAGGRDDEPKSVAGVTGILLLAGLLTGIASIPVHARHRRYPAGDDLPTAQIVER